MTKNSVKQQSDKQCYAVIDIGTLKVKTLVAHLDKKKQLIKDYSSSVLTCFGCELEQNQGIVAEKFLRKTVNELLRIKKLLGKYQVSKFRIVSTHAMRKARNREEVLARIKRETGFKVENISQEQEALLFYRAVMANVPAADRDFALVDVGGGSVQVLIGNAEKLSAKYLLQTGVVYLHNIFTENPHEAASFTKQSDIEKMKGYILEQLLAVKEKQNLPIVYGSTNIIDLMQAINLPLEKNPDFPGHPYKLYAEHLENFIAKVLPLSYNEREEKYPFQWGYMWGIDKAFLNIVSLAKHFRSPYIIPSNANIAQGIIYSLDN